MATQQPQDVRNELTQPAANSGSNTQQTAWSAEVEAQQRGGVPADTQVPMALFRNAVESVVEAGSKKEAEGAKWALMVAELMAAGDAADATEQENETL